MKTFIHKYSTQDALSNFIKSNYIHNYKKCCDILVQVFTSVNDKKFISYLQHSILTLLPDAKILGTTTSGEISDEGALENSTIISISEFDSTHIITTLQHSSNNSFNDGKNIAKKIKIDDELKLLITFTDGLYTNGEEYLNGISSINKDIIVAGGMAGDNSKFERTFVFNEKDITSHGAVMAAFYNKNLNVHTDYSFNWETVGQTHTITRADKNRVYEIDGIKTVDFYKFYLGDDIDRYLPAIGIEFPLVIKKNGLNIARAVLSKHDDGSLSFAGNMEEDSKVQFGHGDVQLIINKGLDNIKNAIAEPVESIFIYSCMARKALLDNEINFELLPLQELAPISGFFTYGEFFYNCQDGHCSSKLLNQTMTIVALSESTKTIDKVSANIFSKNNDKLDDLKLHRKQALSTLIRRTTVELEELNTNLLNKVQEQIELNAQKDAMLGVLHTQAQLGGILEMILHQWRQPISAIVSTLSSIEVYQEAGMLTDDMIQRSLKNIRSYTSYINTTIEDFRDLFKATAKNQNITVDKLIEKSLMIVQPIIKKNSIKLQQNIEQDIELFLPVGLMMQVILNILKNAIDILLEKEITQPQITINAYKQGQNCIIELIDNGGGIPQDILPYIFNKNFTTKSDSDGTGIGLDMSKTIVETKAGGTLSASTIDNCAVFTITLPIKSK